MEVCYRYLDFVSVFLHIVDIVFCVSVWNTFLLLLLVPLVETAKRISNVLVENNLQFLFKSMFLLLKGLLKTSWPNVLRRLCREGASRQHLAETVRMSFKFLRIKTTLYKLDILSKPIYCPIYIDEYIMEHFKWKISLELKNQFLNIFGA